MEVEPGETPRFVMVIGCVHAVTTTSLSVVNATLARLRVARIPEVTVDTQAEVQCADRHVVEIIDSSPIKL